MRLGLGLGLGESRVRAGPKRSSEDGADRDGARRGVASHLCIRPRRGREIVILHDKIHRSGEGAFRRRRLADFDRLALPDVPQPRHRREGEVVHEVFLRKRLRRVRRLVDLGQRLRYLCGNQNFTARSCCIVASSSTPSTPSTRRLLDSVVVLVPHRSTESGRPRHRREMT